MSYSPQRRESHCLVPSTFRLAYSPKQLQRPTKLASSEFAWRSACQSKCNAYSTGQSFTCFTVYPDSFEEYILTWTGYLDFGYTPDLIGFNFKRYSCWCWTVPHDVAYSRKQIRNAQKRHWQRRRQQ